jgi:hypothetical protein
MWQLRREVAGARHLGAALGSTSELQATLRPSGIRPVHYAVGGARTQKISAPATFSGDPERIQLTRPRVVPHRGRSAHDATSNPTAGRVGRAWPAPLAGRQGNSERGQRSTRLADRPRPGLPAESYQQEAQAVRRAAQDAGILRPPWRQCRQLAAARGPRARFACRVRVMRVRCAPHAARTANNVETLHRAETLHAYSVFCFHRTKSFHANGRPGPDGRAAARRPVLNGTTPPSSLWFLKAGGSAEDYHSLRHRSKRGQKYSASCFGAPPRCAAGHQSDNSKKRRSRRPRARREGRVARMP